MAFKNGLAAITSTSEASFAETGDVRRIPEVWRKKLYLAFVKFQGADEAQLAAQRVAQALSDQYKEQFSLLCETLGLTDETVDLETGIITAKAPTT